MSASTIHSSDKPADPYALGWRALPVLAQSILALGAGRRPQLDHHAFARLSALDTKQLPRARRFAVESGGLAYRLYDAPAPVSLILIHGAGCFADQFHLLAKAIAGSGAARVYTLDMRGHGLAEGARGHAVDHPAQLRDDVVAFARHLRKQSPDQHLVVGGHSAGGGLALSATRDGPGDLFDAVLLLAPFLGLGSGTVRPHFGGWAHVRFATLAWGVARRVLGRGPMPPQTAVDFNVEACLHDPRYVRSWSITTALGFGPGLRCDESTAVDPAKPVLLIAGDGDECFVAHRYRQALRRIAPHAKVTTITGAGHWDILAEPKTADRVRRWIKSEFPASLLSDWKDSRTHVA